MNKLSAADLMTLEQYARERPAFRARVLQHKAERQLAVGPDATWAFEDRLTVQYQVQEMLRAERIFEPEGIAEELAAYNPLIPDGSNWKVTLLLEFDAAERSQALARLKGVDDREPAQRSAARHRDRSRALPSHGGAGTRCGTALALRRPRVAGYFSGHPRGVTPC